VSESEITERDLTAEVVADLRARFPTVTPEIVAEHVRRAYAGMASAPVQDYVPVLTERQARLSLTAMIDAKA